MGRYVDQSSFPPIQAVRAKPVSSEMCNLYQQPSGHHRAVPGYQPLRWHSALYLASSSASGSGDSRLKSRISTVDVDKEPLSSVHLTNDLCVLRRLDRKPLLS